MNLSQYYTRLTKALGYPAAPPSAGMHWLETLETHYETVDYLAAPAWLAPEKWQLVVCLPR